MKKLVIIILAALILVGIINGTTALVMHNRYKNLLEEERQKIASMNEEERFLYDVRKVYLNCARKYRWEANVTTKLLTEQFGYQSSSDYSKGHIVTEKIESGKYAINFFNYSNFHSVKKPYEIESVFMVYLYLQKQDSPYVIQAIRCYIFNGFEDIGWIIAIRQREFEELLEEVDITGMKDEKAAQKLAEKWIEKNGYRKR